MTPITFLLPVDHQGLLLQFDGGECRFHSDARLVDAVLADDQQSIALPDGTRLDVKHLYEQSTPVAEEKLAGVEILLGERTHEPAAGRPPQTHSIALRPFRSPEIFLLTETIGGGIAAGGGSAAMSLQALKSLPDRETVLMQSGIDWCLHLLESEHDVDAFIRRLIRFRPSLRARGVEIKQTAVVPDTKSIDASATSKKTAADMADEKTKLAYFRLSVQPQEWQQVPDPLHLSGSRKMKPESEHGYDSPQRLDNWLMYSGIYPANLRLPDATPPFPVFRTGIDVQVLDDLMHAASINQMYGFFVSARARELLERFVLPTHRFYSVEIRHKGATHAYDFLMMAIDGQKLDYAASSFVNFLDDDAPVAIEKFEDLLERFEGNPMFPDIDHGFAVREGIRARCLVFEEAPDIYQQIGGMNFLISERLKVAIEQAGLTGFGFHEVRQIFYCR